MAQLLFLSARARRDIQLPVAFLTTRVKEPDEDDWGKLKRCLSYLKGTLHMKLTLEVEDLGTVHWYVDASDNTHMDCKGHTGGAMTMGKGATISKSSKQKINTKSSAETEIVGADDMLSTALWSKYFIEDLGYTVEHNIMYQDNQASIRLEINGPASSSKRTKHIKRRYFFMADKVAQGDIEVKHKSTDKMWIDCHTKPKQGRPWRIDRSMLMNIPEDYDDEEERTRTHPKLLP